MQTFVIAAMPRSGTKFLANAMNLSKEWTVLHEPRPVKGENRFRGKSRYGEVNSSLLGHQLEIGKTGVISRNFKDVALSWWRAGMLEKPHRAKFVQQANQVLKMLTWRQLVSFERMTTDPDYLKGVLRRFDIDDWDEVPIDEEFCRTVVNSSGSSATWGDVPEWAKTWYDSDVAPLEDQRATQTEQ